MRNASRGGREEAGSSAFARPLAYFLVVLVRETEHISVSGSRAFAWYYAIIARANVTHIRSRFA